MAKQLLILALTAVTSSVITWLTVTATAEVPGETLHQEDTFMARAPADEKVDGSGTPECGDPIISERVGPVAVRGKEAVDREGDEHAEASRVPPPDDTQHKDNNDDLLGALKRVAEGDDPVQYMSSRFQAEPVDYEWATEVEFDIIELFDKHESLVSVAPLSVACRSKNCEVVLPTVGGDEVRRLSQSFIGAVTKADIGMKDQSVSFVNDQEVGQVVFYISDNGNTDLFK